MNDDDVWRTIEGRPVKTEPSRTPSGYPEGRLQHSQGRVYRVAKSGQITRAEPKPGKKARRAAKRRSRKGAKGRKKGRV